MDWILKRSLPCLTEITIKSRALLSSTRMNFNLIFAYPPPSPPTLTLSNPACVAASAFLAYFPCVDETKYISIGWYSA